MARAAKRLPRIAVIMAGGHGTRFWPLARRHRPKQFLSLRGDRSYLQETIRRVLPLFGWDRILVVSGAEHAADVARHLPELPAAQLLVEPQGRNTAACLALAGEWIEHNIGEAVVMAMAADHVVHDSAALRACLRRAEAIAAEHPALVVLGIPPTRPETGFGYIEAGTAIGSEPGSRWVRRFHEKPPLATARRYARSGRHLWNAGMFVWRGSTFRAAMAQCAPEFGERLDGVFAVSATSARRIARAYAALPSLPIDIALLQAITAREQPVARVAVVDATFDWLDAGSWEAMPEIRGVDDAGNCLQGEVVDLHSQRCIVSAGDRLVVLVGVQDLIVVDAGDAVLVCAREQAQDVRNIPAELRRRRLGRYT
jgi:mannose-1-phosphate guanylyltransferase